MPLYNHMCRGSYVCKENIKVRVSSGFFIILNYILLEIEFFDKNEKNNVTEFFLEAFIR